MNMTKKSRLELVRKQGKVETRMYLRIEWLSLIMEEGTLTRKPLKKLSNGGIITLPRLLV